MNEGMVDNYCLLNESELAEYIKWIKRNQPYCLVTLVPIDRPDDLKIY